MNIFSVFYGACMQIQNALYLYFIYRRCKKHQALGFDCEWVTEHNGKRRPVAFIQLSSFDGYCGLFKLNAMKAVPASLKVSELEFY